MHYCVKAYPYEVCLTHASAADGCIAAAEIGNFLFFRTHPSAACAHVICMRTRHMHIVWMSLLRKLSFMVLAARSRSPTSRTWSLKASDPRTSKLSERSGVVRTSSLSPSRTRTPVTSSPARRLPATPDNHNRYTVLFKRLTIVNVRAGAYSIPITS